MTTPTPRITDDKKMDLLHLSYFDDEPVEIFVPRVPERREETEDATVPRICVTSTIKGCIASHPTILDHLSRFIDQNADPYQEHFNKHMLLEHNKLGLLLRIYHLAPDSQSVVDSKTVHETYHVRDALETGEQWILEPCKPERVSYLFIESVEVIPNTDDWKPNYTIYENEDELGAVMPYPDFAFMDLQTPYLDKWMGNGFSKDEAARFISITNLSLAAFEAYVSCKIKDEAAAKAEFDAATAKLTQMKEE